MAKTLNLRVPAGFDNPQPLDDIIVPASPNTGKLSAIVTSILAASSLPMFAVVDFESRRVYSGEVGALDPLALVDAVAGTTLIESIDQVGTGDDRVSAWKNEGNGAAQPAISLNGAAKLEELLCPVVPASYSLAAVIDKIEDAIALQDAAVPTDPLLMEGKAGFLVIDQETKIVSLLKVAEENEAAVRALFADGGSLESTGTYEQIPASEETADTEAFGL